MSGRWTIFGSRCYQAKYIVEVQAQFADPAVTQSTCHTSPALRRRYVPAADTDGQTAAAHHKAATTERAS